MLCKETHRDEGQSYQQTDNTWMHSPYWPDVTWQSTWAVLPAGSVWMLLSLGTLLSNRAVLWKEIYIFTMHFLMRKCAWKQQAARRALVHFDWSLSRQMWHIFCALHHICWLLFHHLLEQKWDCSFLSCQETAEMLTDLSGCNYLMSTVGSRKRCLPKFSGTPFG